MLLKIQGGKTISGVHAVPGNKNAVLPMIAASLLTAEPVTITNVPAISDVSTKVEPHCSLTVSLTMVPVSHLSLSSEESPHNHLLVFAACLCY